MDFDYMDAGKSPVGYEQQLAEIAAIKRDPNFKERIEPFIFVDPRRLEPDNDELKINNSFIKDGFLSQIKQYIQTSTFKGIKLYPPIGYFPFDKRLKPVYDLALQFNLPITSHVIDGSVFYRGKKKIFYHPVLTEMELTGRTNGEFTKWFTHPRNYEILLNPDLLSKHWNISFAEAEKYSNLKICLGHFGGDDQILEHMKPWAGNKNTPNALSLDNWKRGASDPYSWFAVCMALMQKYPNVYADISYTAANKRVLPILKVYLDSNKLLKEKTLYGTDFYVVEKEMPEKEISINVRAALGENLFIQIAETNTERFLSTNVGS
jgi:predicted TIM-barrel fold metal-dependent hydrolase